jgi:hypothetical protein
MVPLEQVVKMQPDVTDAQWDAWKKRVKGDRVEDWEGTVTQVTKVPLFRQCLVLVDADVSRASVSIGIPGADALKYSKGDRVRFSGRVSVVSVMFGVRIAIEDATVEIIN